MKKILVILCVLGVFISAGFAGYSYLKNRPAVIDQVLPAGPILYVQSVNLEKQWEQFKNSSFGQTILNIDYIALLKHSGQSPETIKKWEETKAELVNPTKQLLFNRFFGKEFAVAVYPSDKNFDDWKNIPQDDQAKLAEEIFSSVVFVSRLKPDAQIAEFISGFLGKYSANVTTEKKDYNGKEITVLTVNEIKLRIGYYRYRDLLIFGVGEKPVQKVLDVISQTQSSLHDNPDYQKAAAQFYPQAHANFYYDFEGILQIAADLTQGSINQGKKALETQSEGDPVAEKQKQAMAEMEKQFQKSMRQYRGFEKIIVSHEMAEVYKMRMNFLLNRSKMTPEMAGLYSCQPTVNQTIDFIPQQVMGYSWQNCLNLGYFWGMIKQEIMNQEANTGETTTTDQIKAVEGMLGFSIENDLIPSIGDEVGGFLNDVKTNGPFPLPEVVLFLKIKDRAKFENVLGKLTGQSPVNFLKEDYQGYSLNYLNMSLGQDVQPAYTFIGEYFMIGLNRNLLKSAIDVKAAAAPSLAAGEQFKAVNFGLTGNNSGVFFMQFDRFVAVVKKLMNWSNTWVEQQDQQRQAFLSGSQKRLDDVIAKIPQLEEEYKNLQIKVAELKAQAAVPPELADLEAQLPLKVKEIEDTKEQKAELESIVKSYQENTVNFEDRRYYQEKLINPVLNAWESLKIIGAYSIIKDDAINSEVFIKF